MIVTHTFHIPTRNVSNWLYALFNWYGRNITTGFGPCMLHITQWSLNTYNSRMPFEIKQLVEEVVVTRQARAAVEIVVVVVVVTKPAMGMPMTVVITTTTTTSNITTITTTMMVIANTTFTTITIITIQTQEEEMEEEEITMTWYLMMTATGTKETVKSWVIWCTVLSGSVGLQSLVPLSPEV